MTAIAFAAFAVVIAVVWALYGQVVEDSHAQYTVHQNDGVLIIDDFLSAAECDEVIRVGTPNLKKSVQANVAGVAVQDEYRSSSSTRLPHLNTRFFRSLNRRMAQVRFCLALLKSIRISLSSQVSGLPPSHFQELQMARYENGETYGLHRDEHEQGDRAGGRVATMLVYLSDVESGGETLFTREPLEQLDNLTKLAQKMVHFKVAFSFLLNKRLL